MKHLSRDKLAKYHRFSYQPRFYKEDKEAFKFRASTIERQLENQIAPEKVSSNVKAPKLKRNLRKNSYLLLVTLSVIIAYLWFNPSGLIYTIPFSLLIYFTLKMQKK